MSHCIVFCYNILYHPIQFFYSHAMTSLTHLCFKQLDPATSFLLINDLPELIEIIKRKTLLRISYLYIFFNIMIMPLFFFNTFIFNFIFIEFVLTWSAKSLPNSIKINLKIKVKVLKKKVHNHNIKKINKYEITQHLHGWYYYHSE